MDNLWTTPKRSRGWYNTGMLGDKTRRWLMLRQNGEQAFMAEMDAMDKKTATAATGSIEKMKGKWDAIIRNLYRSAARMIDELEPRLAKEFERMTKEKLDSLTYLKGEKGDDGKTPVKGIDYTDGEKGADGQTPIADVDYPSIMAVQKMIEGEVAVTMMDKKTGMPAESVMKAISEAFKKMNPAMIARALETLQGKERLDYEALKNRPGFDVGGQKHQRTLHRGGGTTGGKETYAYDLSAECNGVLRTFTIPANSRIIAVQDTDAPAGFLRPIVDYTGSGTTTLTLDASVAAPTTGASLVVLYVV